MSDIDRLHRRITAAGHLHRANRVMAVTSKMFASRSAGACETDNPAKGIQRNTEHHRRRYLSGDELARLIRGTGRIPGPAGAPTSFGSAADRLQTGRSAGHALGRRRPGRKLWSKLPSVHQAEGAPQVPLSAPARQLLGEIRDAQTGKRRTMPLDVRVPRHWRQRPRRQHSTRVAAALQGCGYHRSCASTISGTASPAKS